MKQLKQLGIAFGIIAGLIALVALWTYFTDDSITSDTALENIDDTKFPITDYLYYQENYDYHSNENDDANKGNNNANADNTLPDDNADSNPDNTDSSQDNTDSNQNQNKDNKGENANNGINIGNLFNGAKNKLARNDVFDTHTNNATNPELESKRKALQATRNGNIATISPNKTTNYSINTEYGVDTFTNLTDKDVASNEHKLYRTISAMKMIPAVLITNISSDIGGKVIAQVEEDIYAEMGKAILIPKGSKVLGNYSNNNKIGEYRLSVAWTRILTPQGVNIMLTSANGADLAGAMGLIGDLDAKYWQRYGIPLALSTISNGLIITLNNVTSKYSSGSALGEYMTAELMNNWQNDISDIVAEIIKEQIKIQPTIRIEKGSRIFITSNKNIFFPIPKNGEVMARFFDEVKLEETQEEITER